MRYKILSLIIIAQILLAGYLIAADYNKTIQSANLPSSSKSLLSGVTDPSLRQAILNALQGKCTDQQIKGSKIKVNHKEQCEPKGRPPKVPNGKDGQPCYVQGLEGGTVQAMCISGCCVAIKVTSDIQGNNSYHYSENSGFDSSRLLFSGLNSPLFVQSLFQILQSMSQGGDDSYQYPSYNYPNSTYSYPNSNSDSIYNSSDLNNLQYNFPQNFSTSPDSTSSNESNVQNNDNELSNESSVKNIDQFSDSISTEIIKVGDKIVEKNNIIINQVTDLRKNTFNDFTISNTDTINNQAKEIEIIQNEKEAIKLNSHGGKQDILPESPVTGFANEEKIATRPNLSWFDKLIMFFKSLFNY